MKLIEVLQHFSDSDGVLVKPGLYRGDLVRRGYSAQNRNWYWNIVSEGRVVAVTLGHPKHTRAHDIYGPELAGGVVS